MWINILAYIAGSVTTYIIMRSMIKHMRVRSAGLMAESDYYFQIGKLFYKTLSSSQQVEVDTGREMRMIKTQHEQNIKRIAKTGKY